MEGGGGITEGEQDSWDTVAGGGGEDRREQERTRGMDGSESAPDIQIQTFISRTNNDVRYLNGHYRGE